MGQFNTVWISGPGEVSPEGLHQIGKLVVLGLKGRSTAQVQVAEDVFNFIRVERSGRNRMEGISGRWLGEKIAVDRGGPGLHLRFEPSPGGINQKIVTGKVIGCTMGLVQLEEILSAGAKFLL